MASPPLGVACERLTQLDRLHRNWAIIQKRFGGGERLSDVRVKESVNPRQRRLERPRCPRLGEKAWRPQSRVAQRARITWADPTIHIGSDLRANPVVIGIVRAFSDIKPCLAALREPLLAMNEQGPIGRSLGGISRCEWEVFQPVLRTWVVVNALPCCSSIMSASTA